MVGGHIIEKIFEKVTGSYVLNKMKFLLLNLHKLGISSNLNYYACILENKNK